ncbi:hypothetical protein [Rubrivirga sp.]|uniref:hypothetical protein n=1 Tax=Rubrivirga sp. TaxID=1885344 RepID=UPI003B517650
MAHVSTRALGGLTGVASSLATGVLGTYLYEVWGESPPGWLPTFLHGPGLWIGLGAVAVAVGGASALVARRQAWTAWQAAVRATLARSLRLRTATVGQRESAVAFVNEPRAVEDRHGAIVEPDLSTALDEWTQGRVGLPAIVLWGPAYTGKTRALVEWLHAHRPGYLVVIPSLTQPALIAEDVPARIRRPAVEGICVLLHHVDEHYRNGTLVHVADFVGTCRDRGVPALVLGTVDAGGPMNALSRDDNAFLREADLVRLALPSEDLLRAVALRAGMPLPDGHDPSFRFLHTETLNEYQRAYRRLVDDRYTDALALLDAARAASDLGALLSHDLVESLARVLFGLRPEEADRAWHRLFDDGLLGVGRVEVAAPLVQILPHVVVPSPVGDHSETSRAKRAEVAAWLTGWEDHDAGLDVLRSAVEAAPDPAARAEAGYSLSERLHEVGHLDEATAAMEEAAADGRQSDRPEGWVWASKALRQLGKWSYEDERFDDADDLYEAALAQARRAGTPGGRVAEAVALRNQGSLWVARPDRFVSRNVAHERALAAFEAALDVSRRVDRADAWVQTARALYGIGWIRGLVLKCRLEARNAYSHAIAVGRQAGEAGEAGGWAVIAKAGVSLGKMLIDEGDQASEAEDMLRQAIEDGRRAGEAGEAQGWWAASCAGVMLGFLISKQRGRLPEAESFYRGAIEGGRQAGEAGEVDGWASAANAGGNLSVNLWSSRPHEAQLVLDHAVADAEKAGLAGGDDLAFVLCVRGGRQRNPGEWENARASFMRSIEAGLRTTERSITIAAMGLRWAALSSRCLGEMDLDEGNPKSARIWFEQAVDLGTRSGTDEGKEIADEAARLLSRHCGSPETKE